MNWHIMLYPALWAYSIAVDIATGFSPYQLVHGVESVLSVECEIPSLKLAIDILLDTSTLEEHLVHLEQLDEQRRDALVVLEVNKHRVKVQYDKSFRLRRFNEGDLVHLWDQAKEPLGTGKFNPMWHGTYVVKHELDKGTYELVDYEGQPWRSLEMDSILRNTMHDLQLGMIIVYYCIVFCILRFSYGDRVC